MAIHTQVLAVSAVVAHAWAWKSQREAAQDGPGEPVRLEEDNLFGFQRSALALAQRALGHAETNLVAAGEADLAAVDTLQAGLAVTKNPHELLAHDGAGLIPVLVGAGTLFRRGVQHHATELPQALDIRSLRVALNAQTDLEAHTVLLCDPQGRVEVGNVLATVAHITGPRVAHIAGILNLGLRHVNITAVSRKRLCACDESKAAAVVVRLHRAEVDSV
mmetsp:Transcript_6659/g.21005  ORF Transcript_6659/g.21005 Transcript_6659/m.21005 type:complete len:219 (-) Transcript_6659:224-880(-)